MGTATFMPPLMITALTMPLGNAIQFGDQGRREDE
jgi:hypothetical protein